MSDIVPNQRERSKVKRRAAIIEIAQRIFFRKRAIKRQRCQPYPNKSGGSKGTLWSYFTSKGKLFWAVLENRMAVFQTFMVMALNREQDITAVMTRFCEIYISRTSSPDAIALQRIVVSQVDRFPEIGHIFFSALLLSIKL